MLHSLSSVASYECPLYSHTSLVIVADLADWWELSLFAEAFLLMSTLLRRNSKNICPYLDVYHQRDDVSAVYEADLNAAH